MSQTCVQSKCSISNLVYIGYFLTCLWTLAEPRCQHLYILHVQDVLPLALVSNQYSFAQFEFFKGKVDQNLILIISYISTCVIVNLRTKFFSSFICTLEYYPHISALSTDIEMKGHRHASRFTHFTYEGCGIKDGESGTFLVLTNKRTR